MKVGLTMQCGSRLHYSVAKPLRNWQRTYTDPNSLMEETSGSAIAEGPRDVLVSRNSATTKYRYRVALFA